MDRQVEIAKRLASLKQDLGKTELIAVSKYTTIEDIIFAYQNQQFDFGENKVVALKNRANELLEKKMDKIRWHFIGHVQTNKVKDLLKIPHLYAIHSIDSIKLLEEIIKHQALLEGRELKLFFQVNTSHEEEKSGFENFEELSHAVEILLKNKSNLKLYGLMTMGTMRTDNFEGEAHRCFLELKNIKEKLIQKYSLNNFKLSMGMSQDYKIALNYGADYVRIGSAIFN